jgi:hypothetical protein
MYDFQVKLDILTLRSSNTLESDPDTHAAETKQMEDKTRAAVAPYK